MGIVRILLGLALIYFAVMKLLAPVASHAFVGGAAYDLGLTFFSVETWFWIAAIGELLAGLFLFTGHWYKYGAAIALIIMIFAISAAGLGTNAILVTLASLAVLVWGGGAWRICHCGWCCRGHGDHMKMQKGCCGHCKGTENGSGCTCTDEHHQHMMK